MCRLRDAVHRFLAIWNLPPPREAKARQHSLSTSLACARNLEPVVESEKKRHKLSYDARFVVSVVSNQAPSTLPLTSLNFDAKNQELNFGFFPYGGPKEDWSTPHVGLMRFMRRNMPLRLATLDTYSIQCEATG
jgi:hypothetical protein